jgi:O-antigen/teichoic acid export membrane protein
VFGGVGCVISLFAARTSLATPLAAVLTVVLLMTTIFRYYGDVEYRLNLNYPKYFCYYAVLSAGYLLGFGLYFLTKSWYLVFITGEALALVYLAVTGTVFRGFWKTGSSFGVAASRGSALVLSYLITNLTLNMDRLALKYMIGDLAVTQYYVTSLLGKTLVILVAPINTILISYLTRQEKKMDRRQFLLFAGAGALVSAVFFLGTQIGTPLFVWLFYRDLYASVRPLTAIVNLTQILSLFSAYLFMVVLTFAEEKWQLLLQSAHLVIMAALVLFFTPEYGIVGFAAAALAANGIRILAVLLLGIIKANHNSKL